MNYIKINEDGSFIYPYNIQNLRNEMRNVILPKNIPEETLNENDIYIVEILSKPDYNNETQYIKMHQSPSIQDGKWTIGYDVIDYTTEEKSANIRARRNEIIASTDWTQLSDIPYNTKLKWQTYRQDLRDITNQEGFPDNIVWPTIPE